MNQTSFHWLSPNKIFALLLIFFSASFLACEKDPEPVTTNSCITGRVYINDATSDKIPEVKITATGPYGTLTTNSDNNGEYWFRNVGNGTYDLVCSRNGYGSTKELGIQVFGNDTAHAYFETMYLMPDRKLKVAEFSDVIPEDFHSILIKTNGSSCGDNTIGVRFFLSTESDVSNEKFQFSVSSYLSDNCEYFIHMEELYYAGVQTGTMIYLVGYIYNPHDMGYFDRYHDIRIFPTVIPESKSPVISFRFP